MANGTAPSRIHASQLSASRRLLRLRAGIGLRYSRRRPLCVLAQQLVLAKPERFKGSGVRARIAQRNECVAPQIGRVVLRHVESLVGSAQLVGLPFKPVHERYVRFGPIRGLTTGPSLFDTAVPGTDVLADVAAVHLSAELRAVLLRDRPRGLRPVRQTARRVERAGFVEGAGRTRVDAERARAAIELERRRRLD